MAATFIHTCYRILDPARSEDFYVNKLGSLFRRRKVSRAPVPRPAHQGRRRAV
jgi:catechol 2,3-dioxygenase-like lactoylglutathione lyase family enzyme